MSLALSIPFERYTQALADTLVMVGVSAAAAFVVSSTVRRRLAEGGSDTTSAPPSIGGGSTPSTATVSAMSAFPRRRSRSVRPRCSPTMPWGWSNWFTTYGIRDADALP